MLPTILNNASPFSSFIPFLLFLLLWLCSRIIFSEIFIDVDFWHMQAQVMLSDIYPGRAPKMGSTYWDQIHEVGVISVTRRVLKRLHEFLEQVIS